MMNNSGQVGSVGAVCGALKHVVKTDDNTRLDLIVST